LKRKKFLILAAAGMIVSAILSLSVMATEQAASTPFSDVSAPDQESHQTAPSVNSVYSGEMFHGETVPYPTDIQLLEQGARNYLYKTYTVAADYDPDLLAEPSFSQGGYRYRFSEIIQRESSPASNTKTVTESKTVDSSTNDQAEILALFGGKLPYSDAEGYEGELFLIPESLIISLKCTLCQGHFERS